MKLRVWKTAGSMALLVSLIMLLNGCSGGGGSGGGTATAPAGAVQVSLTDAPGFDYDHVWITVKDI